LITVPGVVDHSPTLLCDVPGLGAILAKLLDDGPRHHVVDLHRHAGRVAVVALGDAGAGLIAEGHRGGVEHQVGDGGVTDEGVVVAKRLRDLLGAGLVVEAGRDAGDGGGGVLDGAGGAAAERRHASLDRLDVAFNRVLEVLNGT